MGVTLTVDIGGSTQTCIKFVIFCALGMKTHIHARPPITHIKLRMETRWSE